MPPVLPELFEFGEPNFDFYPDLVDLESSLSASADAQEEVEQPFGVDFGFDFVTGEFELTPSGDLRIVSENRALEQWISVALTTPRGRDLLYSNEFGSSLSELVGLDLPEEGFTSSLTRMLSETLLQHDRIEEVKPAKISFQDGIVQISIVVIRDDARELIFEGLEIGR